MAVNHEVVSSSLTEGVKGATLMALFFLKGLCCWRVRGLFLRVLFSFFPVMLLRVFFWQSSSVLTFGGCFVAVVLKFWCVL